MQKGKFIIYLKGKLRQEKKGIISQWKIELYLMITYWYFKIFLHSIGRLRAKRTGSLMKLIDFWFDASNSESVSCHRWHARRKYALLRACDFRFFDRSSISGTDSFSIFSAFYAAKEYSMRPHSLLGHPKSQDQVVQSNVWTKARQDRIGLSSWYNRGRYPRTTDWRTASVADDWKERALSRYGVFFPL